MKQDDLKYIRENYLTLEELSRKSGIETEFILKMIAEKLVPAASYTITENTEIFSPLGDSIVYTSRTDYYPSSTTELLSRRVNQQDSTDFKQTFKANFRRNLESHPSKEYAYGNIFDGEGLLLETEFEKAFEEEWQAYVSGIYGICTNNATEEEIVKKEIAVKKLIEFNTKYGGRPLSMLEKEELIRLKEEFDSVANLFAPYQRATSSRGKYLDQVLQANGLSDLIRQY